MSERIDYLAGVYCTEGMSQQVLELGRRTEELQQVIKVQLPNLQDAAKVNESSFSNASWHLGWCMHRITEIISSEDNLWSIQGMTVLSEVRCLVLFKILPSGAGSDGHKISAGPVLSALSGWIYLG